MSPSSIPDPVLLTPQARAGQGGPDDEHGSRQPPALRAGGVSPPRAAVLQRELLPPRGLYRLNVGGPDMAPQFLQAKGATPPSDSPGQRSEHPGAAVALLCNYFPNQSRSGLTTAPALTSASRTAGTIFSAPGLSPWMQMVSIFASMTLPVIVRTLPSITMRTACSAALAGSETSASLPSKD